jgi:hypothetical protein
MKEKFEDTRIRKSKKNRQHNGQQKKTEEQTTQWSTEKNRQHNGQQKKDNRTNNDLQNITYKTKNRVTRTPLNIDGELR